MGFSKQGGIGHGTKSVLNFHHGPIMLSVGNVQPTKLIFHFGTFQSRHCGVQIDIMLMFLGKVRDMVPTVCCIFSLPGMSLDFVCIDVLHALDLGCTQDAVGNCLYVLFFAKRSCSWS